MGCGYRDYTVDEAPHVGRWLVGFGFTVPFSRDDGLIRVQQETFTLMSFSEPAPWAECWRPVDHRFFTAARRLRSTLTGLKLLVLYDGATGGDGGRWRYL